MRLKFIFAVAVATVFFESAYASAEKEGKTPKKTKTELQKENARLSAGMDSLTAEISRLNLLIQQKDSLTADLMDKYDTEGKASGSLSDTLTYSTEVTDSLLNIWYLHKTVEDNNSGNYNMDSVTFQSDVPDSVYIERIKAMNSFITLPYNSIVRNYIILYSEKMQDRMSKVLSLCSYYMPIFQQIFNEYDIPEELKAMAVIESSLNPTAVSRAGAKGMWQFMYGTAKLYGLRIDSFVDERMDPVRAAHAAAQYLSDSYRIFGDWNLAIASYNCGAGNVNKAIRRSGSRNFWDIYPYLPRETRGYVPAFVGALYTMKYYKEHGITPDPIIMPPVTDTFRINRMLHFKQIEELVGIPAGDLRNLNPQYRHDIIPGNEREYILTIPFNYVNAFIDNEKALYTHKADVYFNPVTIKKIKEGGDGQRIVYKVKSGDVLGKIAMRYRVSVNSIKKWNNLKSNNIRVGQKLVIYSGVKEPANVQAETRSATETSSAARTQATPKPSVDKNLPYTTYTVKKGDTLYDIAKMYPGVSAQNIMDFNGTGNRIYPGLVLKIPKL